jgi:hypothetical protein
MPLDDLLAHFLEAIVDLRDIDILAPSLLALATRLLVLRGRCYFRVRHGVYRSIAVVEVVGLLGVAKSSIQNSAHARGARPGSTSMIPAKARSWEGLQIRRPTLLFRNAPPRHTSTSIRPLFFADPSPSRLESVLDTYTQWHKQATRIRSRSSSACCPPRRK